MSIKITSYIVGKPVTAFLIFLSIVFFGFLSFIQFRYEMTPEINKPTYVVSTIFPGTQPEDIELNITKKLENEVQSLSGVSDIQSTSQENVSIVAVQYEYGENMDKAYSDLKKVVDKAKTDFPEGAKEPTISKVDIMARATIKFAVTSKSGQDIYSFVNQTFSDELRKISNVSSIDVFGGRENYISVALRPEMMTRYGLSMDTIAAIVKNADFVLPGGDLNVGDRKLPFSTNVEYNTVRSLKNIPITTGNGRTLYLSDIADIYEAQKDPDQFARYSGNECMVVAVTKSSDGSTLDISEEAHLISDRMMEEYSDINIQVIEDAATNVKNAIRSVFETLIIAIILSMIVVFLFIGDVRVSLIIGTSIPFSLLTAIVGMYLSKFTMNIITLSALVLGAGMMVDNSIVVIEACFRECEKYLALGKNSVFHYSKAALHACYNIGSSVFGSTLTTVVVFLPFAFIQGMAGQAFVPLGLTIVYCMLASYASAITVVPLAFILVRPKENKKSISIIIIEHMQDGYRKFVKVFINHKIVVVVATIILIFVTGFLATSFDVELVPNSDNGMLKLEIITKPGLNYEKRDEIFRKFEEYITSQPETDTYLLSNSSTSYSITESMGGQELIVYLKNKKERGISTKNVLKKWKDELSKISNCTLYIEEYSNSSFSGFKMPVDNKFSVELQSHNYDKLKKVNDEIVEKLKARGDCSMVSSSLENAIPLISGNIDPILATAQGFTPASVAGSIYNTLSGIEIKDMDIDNKKESIYIEYKGEYETPEDVKNITVEGMTGLKTTLKDIMDITYKDNPNKIERYNRKYKTIISAYLNQNASKNAKDDINNNLVSPYIYGDIELAESIMNTQIRKEFANLFIVIFISCFLVFVVMASQFESVRYSFMVMSTILLSFVGGIISLWLVNLKISMPVLIGFLMLVGIAVNNGILYVDTVNRFLDDGKEIVSSLIEAGALRLKPILMTTLTTIVSMIPMACAYGEDAELLQGVAVVNIGGLLASTFSAIFILPVFYYIFSSRKRTVLEKLAPIATDAVAVVNQEEELRKAENLERRKVEGKQRVMNLKE